MYVRHSTQLSHCSNPIHLYISLPIKLTRSARSKKNEKTICILPCSFIQKFKIIYKRLNKYENLPKREKKLELYQLFFVVVLSKQNVKFSFNIKIPNNFYYYLLVNSFKMSKWQPCFEIPFALVNVKDSVTLLLVSW